ncbi:MAG: DUF6061 family protein [Faecalibacterium sp.]
MKYGCVVHCHFNMDTGCVELLTSGMEKISINCTGVEDALDVTMAHVLDRNWTTSSIMDPLAYAELILKRESEEYLFEECGLVVTGSED